MKRLYTNTMQIVIALGISLRITVAVAAPPVIGTIVTRGSFRLDNATVAGNATLIEGAVLETSFDSSTVELSSGARLVMGASSKGRLFGDHIVLEKGQARFENAAGYRLEALGLTIQPETGAARGRVAVAGVNRVQVAALTGSFRVLNSRGVLVANMPPGAAMEFEPQQSGGASRVTGCLQTVNGRLILRDETTNVTVEVAGPGLNKESGNRVELAGSLDPSATPVSDASQYIRVARVTRISKSCTVGRPGAVAAGVGGAGAAGAGASGAGSGAAGAGGGAAGAAGSGAAGAAAGISGATVAILGGVAAAATIGGLAATGSLPGQRSTPTVSR